METPSLSTREAKSYLKISKQKSYLKTKPKSRFKSFYLTSIVEINIFTFLQV